MDENYHKNDMISEKNIIDPSNNQNLSTHKININGSKIK